MSLSSLFTAHMCLEVAAGQYYSRHLVTCRHQNSQCLCGWLRGDGGYASFFLAPRRSGKARPTRMTFSSKPNADDTSWQRKNSTRIHQKPISCNSGPLHSVGSFRKQEEIIRPSGERRTSAQTARKSESKHFLMKYAQKSRRDALKVARHGA